MIYKKQNQDCNYTFKNVNFSSSQSSHRPCCCRDFCDFHPKQNCENSCQNNNCWNNDCNQYQHDSRPCNNWQNCPCCDNCNPPPHLNDRPNFYPPHIPKFDCCKPCTQNDFRYFLIGYLIGLASGFGYALYSIFGKFAVKKYTPYTISFYTFLVATIALVPTTQIWNVFPTIMNVETILNIIGLSLISTVFAFLLYTKGLQGIESSKASILATVEPLAAMVIGIVIFQESITGVQLLGGAFIFISATLVSIDFKAFKKGRLL